MSVDQVYPPIAEGGLSGGDCSTGYNALMNYKILYVPAQPLFIFSFSEVQQKYLSPPNIMKEVLMVFYFIDFILVEFT